MWDLALMQSTKVLLVAYSNQGRAIYFRGKIGMQSCSKCIKPRSNKQANMYQSLICTVWIHRRWSSSAFITCNSRRSSRMKNQIIIETFPSSWSSFGCWGAVQTKTGSIVSWVVKNRTPIYCLFDADLVLMIVDMIILKREKLKEFLFFRK